MNDFWEHCSALLARELTPQQYVTWIKPLTPVDFDADANTLSIAAPNRFKLDWVKSQFSSRITDLARDYWHSPVDVQFVLDPKAGMRPAQAMPSRSSALSANAGTGAVDAAISAVHAAQAARVGGVVAGHAAASAA